MTQDKNLKLQLDKFKQNKEYSILLANSYNRLGKENKFLNTYHCGDFLEFTQYIKSGQVRLTGANFCKDRLCPQCAKRRSLKVFSQLSLVLQELKKYKYQYLFCTLTLKNCNLDGLDITLDNISIAFKKFRESSFFRGKNKQFLGCFKSVEITRNHSNGTLHPHLHLLIAVDKYYFSNFNTYYVKSIDISDCWRDCLGVNYNPSCTLNAVKKIKNVTCEVAKYITKGSDFLFKDDEKLTDTLVDTFSNALYNKRFISYVGCFYNARKKLKLKDDDNLINFDAINNCDELEYIVKRYRWNIGLSNYEELRP